VPRRNKHNPSPSAKRKKRKKKRGPEDGTKNARIRQTPWIRDPRVGLVEDFHTEEEVIHG
jgi:ribosomal protein L19E